MISGSSIDNPREPFTRISVSEAKEKLETDQAVMIDVRDPHEYAEVHASGVLLVPVKGRELKITFDDWIFKQDERVAINRATMTKFGFKVAELTVVFVKD